MWHDNDIEHIIITLKFCWFVFKIILMKNLHHLGNVLCGPLFHYVHLCAMVRSNRPRSFLRDPFLTHWGRVTHICVSKLTIIGSDNGLSPDRRQAIICTNAGVLLIGTLGTNFSETLIEIITFFIQETAFGSVVCETAAILSRPQCVKNGTKTTTICYQGSWNNGDRTHFAYY